MGQRGHVEPGCYGGEFGPTQATQKIPFTAGFAKRPAAFAAPSIVSVG